MPLIKISLYGKSLPATTCAALQGETTRLMQDILHKEAGLTVVSVQQFPAAGIALAGQPMSGESRGAYLEALITAGSNTVEELAAFQQAAYAMLQKMLGEVALPAYVAVNGVPAAHWGYDGLSQAQRRADRYGQATLQQRPESLQELAGLAPAQIAPEKTVLLLIDYQREYLDGRLPLFGVEAALCQARALHALARQAAIKVVHVHHHALHESAALFAPGGTTVQPVVQPLLGEEVLIKHQPSSFAGTALSTLLANAEQVVIAGFMTHNCVDATAREAFHRGLRVLIIGDACATRDLAVPGGDVLPAAVIQQASLAGLADRMASVLSLDEWAMQLAA